MGDYLPVFTLAVLAVLFVLVSLVVSRLLAPARSTRPKSAFYECGITDTVAPPERFPVKFYLVAMLFVLFDLEAVFFYPWGALFRDLGLYGYTVMSIFTVPLVIGLLYEWRKGALEW